MEDSGSLGAANILRIVVVKEGGNGQQCTCVDGVHPIHSHEGIPFLIHIAVPFRLGVREVGHLKMIVAK